MNKMALLIISTTLISTNLYARGSSRPKPRPPKRRWSAPKSRRVAPRRMGSNFVNKYYSECIKDVERKLGRMSKRYRYVSPFKVDRRQFHNYGYRMSVFNKNTLGIDNHFQGLTTIRGRGNYLMTGADYKRREAHIFAVKNNRVVKKVTISRGELWHAGGVQSAGQVVAVPVEAFKSKPFNSIVLFYDVRNPSNPIKLPVKISRPGKITPFIGFYRRKEDGKYILTAYTQLYISKSSNILHGFQPPQTLNNPRWESQGQTLVRDCRTKQYYSMAFRNTDKLAPFKKGTDMMYFQRLNFSDNKRFVANYSHNKAIKFTTKWMKCNFSAATHLATTNNRFQLLATHHYRSSWGGSKIYHCSYY